MPIYSHQNYVDAKRLINAVEQELDCGTKFFNQAGRQLTNIKTVILALCDEGKVTIEPTPARAEEFRRATSQETLGSEEEGVLWTPGRISLPRKL